MSDKYQQEIEEILRQAEGVMPKDRPRSGSAENKSGPAGKLFGRLPGGGFKISAGKLMLTSLALLLLALVLGSAGVGVFFLLVAGLVLFVIAYVLLVVRPGAPVYEKRWRGRLIEERPSMWDRMRRWLRG